MKQTVGVFSSIAELPREEWDQLIAHNVFATHGWLRTVEATFIGDIRPLYLLIREGKTPIGATVCYIFCKTGTVEDLDDLLLGRAKPLASRLGISFMPTMVCGTLWGCGDHLAVELRADPERKRAVKNMLLDVAEREAERNGLTLSLINVPEGDLELAAILRQRGYSRSRHVPLTLLDLPWPSFGDYVKHLDGINRHARKNLRNQINRNRKGGTTVAVLENFVMHAERLHELLSMNYRKHRNMPFCFSKNFFSQLERNLGPNAVLHISRKAGVITGVAVELRYNGASFVSLVGIDHQQCGNDMTYFVLTFYTPIAEAISDGMSRVYFGRGHYLMKIRLGCRTTDLFIWHKSRRRVVRLATRLWFVLLSCRNRYKLPGRVRLTRVVGAYKNPGKKGQPLTGCCPNNAGDNLAIE